MKHPPIGEQPRPAEPPPKAPEVWGRVEDKPHLEQDQHGHLRTRNYMPGKPLP
jgi:hypothetical protein